MHVFVIAAISVDGQIAQSPDQVSTAWTSKEDHKFFVQRTKQAGAMVFGSGTFKTFNRLLPGRANIVYTRDVEQFRATATLPIQEITTETTDVSQTDVLYVTSIAPIELVEVLKNAGIEELAVCGGSTIYSQFMKAELVETLYLTIEPVAFGRGVPLFSEALNVSLNLKSIEKLSEQTILLEYGVMK